MSFRFYNFFFSPFLLFIYFFFIIVFLSTRIIHLFEIEYEKKQMLYSQNFGDRASSRIDLGGYSGSRIAEPS